MKFGEMLVSNQLNITADGRKRVLELMRYAGGHLPKDRKPLLESHLLLQRRQFCKVADEADNPRNLVFGRLDR